MLLRLALRPDRAVVVAAVGVAAGILLPVLGSLVLANLAAPASPHWVAYAPAGDALDVDAASRQPLWVLAQDRDNASRFAYVQAGPGPTPLLPAGARIQPLADLGDPVPVMAVFTGRAAVPGAYVAPLRGADAFELAAQDSLQAQGLLLVALSVPAVAIVAAALATQEARARRHQAATIAALGAPRRAFLLLAARVALAVAAGAVLATAIGFGFYQWGPSLFHPDDAPRLALALGIAVPSLAAILVGTLQAWRVHRATPLQEPGPQGDRDVAIAAPLALRPLLLGFRPLLILAVAGLLFAVDVGFPLAAAGIPASLGGTRDEWVFGSAVTVGHGVDASFADVADLAGVTALAETIAPTLIDGQAAVVRGGSWQALRDYHGLRIVQGREPGAGDIALGTALAQRLGVALGDHVVVHGGDGADRVELRVRGLVEGNALLEQEAFVAQATGQRLAHVPAGQATLLHVKPATPASLQAAQQEAAEIVVARVDVSPANPVAGSVAQAAIDVANLGAQAGRRVLVVRVNGDPVGTLDVPLQGHDRRVLTMAFVVPTGPVDVEVNPATQTTSTPQDAAWTAPLTVPAGQPFEATLLRDGAGVAGVPVGLFAGAEAAATGQAHATATTDEAGSVRFTLPTSGTWLLGPTGGPFHVIQGTGNASVAVVAVWTVPAQVTLGQPMQVFAQVRNEASTTRNATVTAFAGPTSLGDRDLVLEPGQAARLDWTLLLVKPAASVRVGDYVLPLQAVPVQGGATAPATNAQAPTAKSGEHVQAEVADRALGNAKGALVGLAGTAAATTLAVVALTVRRTLAGRQHVSGLLRVLGWDDARLRHRAAAEGFLLGATGALVALVPAKLVFVALGAWGPTVFAHNLPDPVGWLYAVQVVASFGGICALAAYFEAAQASPG